VKKLFLPLSLITLCLLAACANVVPPAGGPKDVTPPKLLQVSPADSQLNTRVTQLRLTFDEFVTLNNPAQQISLSPLLPVPLEVTMKKRSVLVKIPDSLLQENTTYQLSFGNAIQDLHEGNPFSGYSYIFSTGPYFDSLALEGKVFNAATGLPDTTAFVLLYDAALGDSAIARRKPQYVTHADASGTFNFRGLPRKEFQLYALRDANNNLVYDGGSEWIAFHDRPVQPAPDTTLLFPLYLFQEENSDTSQVATTPAIGRRPATTATASRSEQPPYQVLADTSNTRNRTFNIKQDLVIQLRQKPLQLEPRKIFLSYDSSGISIEASITVQTDTLHRILIQTQWKEDALYELRLQKGFAQDSAGNDLMPGIYTFRTKRKEDYGTMRLHLPSKYLSPDFVLEITGPTEKTVLHRGVVTDTILSFPLLDPGPYTIRIIEDRNHNGIWDSGTLFPKKQPEKVTPYPSNPVRIREGWDNEIDFEPVRKQ